MPDMNNIFLNIPFNADKYKHQVLKRRVKITGTMMV